jgi:hypothetical protein
VTAWKNRGSMRPMPQFRFAEVFIFVLACLGELSACKRKTDSHSVPSASARSSSADGAAAAQPRAFTAPSVPEQHAASKPIDKRAYDLALNEGRAATRSGKYHDAYAAFDRALEAWPHDPKAIAERGYAHRDRPLARVKPGAQRRARRPDLVQLGVASREAR